MRVLFTSRLAIGEPSNGASLSVRDLLEMLARRGADVRAFTGDATSRADEPPLTRARIATFARGVVDVADGTHAVHGTSLVDARMGSVPLRYLLRDWHRPDDDAKQAYEDELAVELDRFQPDVVLMHGHTNAHRNARALADARGIPVVVRMVSYAFLEMPPEHMRGLAGVLTCSRDLASALDAIGQPVGAPAAFPILSPVDVERVQPVMHERRCLTYVSPCSEKGAALAAALFKRLAVKRPDVPVLVVVGRGRASELLGAGSDLTDARNVQVLETTPDPRTFLSLTRVLLMPSVREPSGKVASEALVCGIPVLGAARGGLPETVGDGGVLLPLPRRVLVRYPTALSDDEVAPWLHAVERLWDDDTHHDALVARAFARGAQLTLEALTPSVVGYFERITGKTLSPTSTTTPRSPARPFTPARLQPLVP